MVIPPIPERIDELCRNQGIRLTEARRLILHVLLSANDHPDVEALHKRVNAFAPEAKLSLATVYRTVALFCESGVLTKHDFKDGRARYEETGSTHHDHLIDVSTGQVIEFVNDEIEKLQEKIAHDLGYELLDHRLELYVRPLSKG